MIVAVSDCLLADLLAGGRFCWLVMIGARELPISRRRGSVARFEVSNEMADAHNADSCCHLLHAEEGAAEQLLGFCHAQVSQMPTNRRASLRPKHVA